MHEKLNFVCCANQFAQIDRWISNSKKRIIEQTGHIESESDVLYLPNQATFS